MSRVPETDYFIQRTYVEIETDVPEFTFFTLCGRTVKVESVPDAGLCISDQSDK